MTTRHWGSGTQGEGGGLKGVCTTRLVKAGHGRTLIPQWTWEAVSWFDHDRDVHDVFALMISPGHLQLLPCRDGVSVASDDEAALIAAAGHVKVSIQKHSRNAKIELHAPVHVFQMAGLPRGSEDLMWFASGALLELWSLEAWNEQLRAAVQSGALQRMWSGAMEDSEQRAVTPRRPRGLDLDDHQSTSNEDD